MKISLSRFALYIESKKRKGANISAVQISAAITAYGRIFLNQFSLRANMKNNHYLGGDTDSIIFSQPLDSN